MTFEKEEDSLTVFFSSTIEAEVSLLDNKEDPKDGSVLVSSEALNNQVQGAALAPDLFTSDALLWEERTITFKDLDTGTAKEFSFELDRRESIWTLTTLYNGKEHTIELEQSVINRAKDKGRREDLNLAALFFAFKVSGLFCSVNLETDDRALDRSCKTYRNGND